MTCSDKIMGPREFRNAISKEVCESIIENFRYGDTIYRNKREYSFKEVMMCSTPELNALQMQLIETTNQYVSLWRNLAGIDIFPQKYGYEAVRVKRYDYDDEDQFPWHADVMDYQSAKRFLVCMFYLNDNFVGGETDFGSEEKINYTIEPEQGKLVIFTPFWDNPHRGRKLVSGSKYIANVYLHLL